MYMYVYLYIYIYIYTYIHIYTYYYYHCYYYLIYVYITKVRQGGPALGVGVVDLARLAREERDDVVRPHRTLVHLPPSC